MWHNDNCSLFNLKCFFITSPANKEDRVHTSALTWCYLFSSINLRFNLSSPLVFLVPVDPFLYLTLCYINCWIDIISEPFTHLLTFVMVCYWGICLCSLNKAKECIPFCFLVKGGLKAEDLQKTSLCSWTQFWPPLCKVPLLRYLVEWILIQSPVDHR